MKGAQSALTIWILGLPQFVSAHASPNALDESHRSFPKLPSPPSTPNSLRTTTLVISYLTRSSSTGSPVPSPSTASSASSPLPTFDAMATAPVNSLWSPSPDLAPDPSTSSESPTAQRRTLIIILSSVLGSIGIILISVSIFLACRYRKRQAPFRRRGVTPINDDEIDSWRGSEQKQKPTRELGSAQTPRGPSMESVILKHSPGWTWTGSPNALHSINSPGPISEPPDFIARAPNSRVGLTDETVPGADAFIPPIKRQSSRLSKPPPGHARSKSRRSSMSAKSVRSYSAASPSDFKSKERIPTWYDPESDSVGIYIRDTERTNSSPGTSLFDGLSAGGLSPRPKSRTQLQRPWGMDEKEIGRAIA